MARVLMEIGHILRSDDDLELRELMDGSFKFETSHGDVYMTVMEEE
jgi:hypothetical protein